MIEIEEKIIGSVFGEDQYRRVSFLEPMDFKNYEGRPYRRFWEMVKENEAYDLTLIRLVAKTKDKGLINALGVAGNLVAYNNVDRYAILLLEARFKRLLSELLGKLSFSSKNRLEVELLNECQIAVATKDIFDLSDNLIEYLGSQASETTKSRIEAFLEYRDKRVNEAKMVVNAL